MARRRLSNRLFAHHLLLVKHGPETRVLLRRESLTTNVLGAALAQVRFKHDGIACIGLERDVQDVAEEGDEPNDKVESNVKDHLGLDTGGEADFGCGTDHHHREEH